MASPAAVAAVLAAAVAAHGRVPGNEYRLLLFRSVAGVVERAIFLSARYYQEIIRFTHSGTGGKPDNFFHSDKKLPEEGLGEPGAVLAFPH